MTEPRSARDIGVGVAVLVLAVLVACAVVAFGPPLAQRWIAPHVDAGGANAQPLIETLFTVLIYGAFIVAAAAAGLVERINVVAAGRRPGAMLGVGLCVGFAGMTIAMLYARLAGTLVAGASEPAPWGVLTWGAAVVGVQTAAEEIYFRGWVQPALARRWGLAAAVLVTAVAFAGVHVVGGARGPVSLLNLFLGGLMFGLFAAHGRGLAAAAGTHFAWNAAEQLVWGLDPNPGLGSFGALVDKELVGSALWGGSDEGLNASLGMTAALLAILVPLVLLTWRGTAGAPVARPDARAAIA